MTDLATSTCVDQRAVHVIEVFADVVCPFTHVGLLKFVERRAAMGRSDVHLWIRAWPLEIVNGKPLDPRKVGEEIAEVQRTVAPGLFRGFAPASFPQTSIPALTLTARAYEIDVATGERVALALRWALFEHGIDIADTFALQQIAARHGITDTTPSETLIRAEHRAGVARGVVGSPHFFTAHGDYFCPGLDVSHDAAGRVRIARSGERFDNFMNAALSAA